MIKTFLLIWTVLAARSNYKAQTIQNGTYYHYPDTITETGFLQDMEDAIVTSLNSIESEVKTATVAVLTEVEIAVKTALITVLVEIETAIKYALAIILEITENAIEITLSFILKSFETATKEFSFSWRSIRVPCTCLSGIRKTTKI